MCGVGEGVWCVGVGCVGLGVCVWGQVGVCVCGVCGRGVCAGMHVVCGICLWMVRAEAETERHSQAKDNAVCVWYARSVCEHVCGVWFVKAWSGGDGQRQRDTVRQRTMCMDGYSA